MSTSETQRNPRAAPIADPSEPLTEREKRLIARILSEPMELPLVFRGWVKNYVETVGIRLPRSSIVGLQAGTMTFARNALDERLPAGSVFLFAGDDLPEGTIPLEGGTAARSGYPRLAAALGAEGESFALPDYRGAAPPGLRYVIVTGERPPVVPESEEA